MVDISNKLQRMGRRRFLQSLIGLGISGATLDYMSQEALAELNADLSSEVPRIEALIHTNHEEVENGAAPEIKPVYYTISRDKWTIVESAHDAREQIENRLDSLGLDFNVTVTTITSGQQQKKAVVVEYMAFELPSGEIENPNIPFDRLNDILPATVDGIAGRGTASATVVENIPVLTERVTSYASAYGSKYRPVPGGCKFHATGGSRSEICTIGTPVYDRDRGRHRLVTASHCFYDAPQHNTYAHQPHQSYNGSFIGRRRIPGDGKIDFRHSPLFDAAVINHGSGITYQLAKNGGGYRKRVVGIVSNARLKDMEGTNGRVYKQGKTTGVKYGRMINVGRSSFRTSAAQRSGDSGGPHYINCHGCNGLPAIIAGIHRGHYSGDAQATKMIDIANRWNLRI